MSYYFSKESSLGIEEAEARVREELKKEGVGVLTEIDVKQTLKSKLDVDFKPYKILGACNPPFAHKALQAEEHIGLMLPCNVVLQEKAGKTLVSAIDPVASMQAVDNSTLQGIAAEIQVRLKRVIESL